MDGTNDSTSVNIERMYKIIETINMLFERAEKILSSVDQRAR